jgi:hypothetical protein
LRHHVGVADVAPRAFPHVELHLDPVPRLGQRRGRLGVRVVRVEGGRGVVRHVRQLDRQEPLGQRDGVAQVRFAVRADGVDDRERLTPIPLPGEKPVTQLVLHGALAIAALGEPFGDRFFGLVDG